VQLQYNFGATGISDDELRLAKQLYDPSQQGAGSDYGWVYVNVTATDAITQVYEKPLSETTQEQPPAGMAEYLYNALAQLHQEGDFPIKEQECGGAIQVGNALNLGGGRAEWETMQAQVQKVTEEIESGVTTATVGPAKHLSPADLLELLRSWRTVHMTKQLEARQTGKNDDTLGGNDGIGQTPQSSSAIQPAPAAAGFVPWLPSDATDSGGTKCKIGNGTILKSRKIDDALTISGLNTAFSIVEGIKIWIDVSITNNGDGSTDVNNGELQNGAPAWGTDPVEVESGVQTDFNILLAEVVAVSDPRDGILCGSGVSQLKVVPLSRSNWLMRLDADPDGAGAGLVCWVAEEYSGAAAT